MLLQHSRNVCHGDLKTENILLRSGDTQAHTCLVLSQRWCSCWQHPSSDGNQGQDAPDLVVACVPGLRVYSPLLNTQCSCSWRARQRHLAGSACAQHYLAGVAGGCWCRVSAEPQDPDGLMAAVADFGLSRALAFGQVSPAWAVTALLHSCRPTACATCHWPAVVEQCCPVAVGCCQLVDHF